MYGPVPPSAQTSLGSSPSIYRDYTSPAASDTCSEDILMKNQINVHLSLLAALVISIAGAAPARAQSPARTDSRWIPYLGCWHLVTDNVRNQGIEALIRSAEQSAATPRMTVCVQPSATSTGVTMTTFA